MKKFVSILAVLFCYNTYAQSDDVITITHRFKIQSGKYYTSGIRKEDGKYYYINEAQYTKAIPNSDTLDALFANYNFNIVTDSLLVAECGCPIDSQATISVKRNGMLIQHFKEAAYCDKPCKESYAYMISACLNRYDKKYYWGSKYYSKAQLKNKDNSTMSHYYCSSVNCRQLTLISYGYVKSLFKNAGRVANKAPNECVDVPTLNKYSINGEFNANAYFFSDSTGAYLQLEYGKEFVYWFSNQYANYKLVNFEYFKDQLLVVLGSEKFKSRGIGLEYSISNKSISVNIPDFIEGD